MTRIINNFSGNFRFLSNFYPAEVEYEGILFPTSEHAYQAAKTLIYTERLAISKLDTPGEAKKAGRRLNKVRDDWEAIKYDEMVNILRIKFYDRILMQRLLATINHVLVEGNHWHDNIWGDCQCPKCRNKRGLNLLGKALMQIRDEWLSHAAEIKR